jgi:integrase
VAAYLTDHADQLKVSTLSRRLAAIRASHAHACQPLDLRSQAFRDVWAGIRRKHATRPNRKHALRTVDLRKILAELPDNVIGKRDRALLLIGFASAMRRSELASLVLGDAAGHRVSFTDNGLLIELDRSKSDQEGKGGVIGVPFGSHAETCPVRALRAWLDASGIASGPVFRHVTRHGCIGHAAMTGHGIALAIKRAVYRAIIADGYGKEAAAKFVASVAGHSLRTTRGYIREADAFRDNAASYLGL